MKWLQARQALESSRLPVFTSQEFRRLLRLTPASAKFLLLRSVQRGAIRQLKKGRGIYCLADRTPPPFVLANRLYRPSYVSLESALAHHGLLPETVYAVTSATPKITREFAALGARYTYQSIKRPAFTGYEPVEVAGQTALIASPAKALADYLYFVHLGRKTWNDRIRWQTANKRKILAYLKLFERRGLAEWGARVIP